MPDATERGGSLSAIMRGIKTKQGALTKVPKEQLIAESAKLAGIRGHSRGAAKAEMAKVKNPNTSPKR